MPVLTRNSRSNSSASSLHYISYGTYKKNLPINQPHATRGDKSINVRNYLTEGINCPNKYKDAVRLYSKYNLMKPSNKIQCTNVVVAFGQDFDWRKPEDLQRGQYIVHHFCNLAFPNHAIYTGYQMDTSGKKPSAHVHLCIGQFNLLTGKSLRGSQYSLGRMRYIVNEVTSEYNIIDAHKITDMTQYAHHGIASHKNVQPSLPQRRLLPKLGMMIDSHMIDSNHDVIMLGKPLGVQVHIHEAGESRATKKHPERKPYKHESIMFRIAGKHGTNGYQSASQLKWLDKYQHGLKSMGSYPARQKLYKANQQYLQMHPVISADKKKIQSEGENKPKTAKADMQLVQRIYLMNTRKNIQNLYRDDDDKRILSIVMNSLSNNTVKKATPLLADKASSKKDETKVEDKVKASSKDKSLIADFMNDVKNFAQKTKQDVISEYHHIGSVAGDWLEKHGLIDKTQNHNLHAYQDKVQKRHILHERNAQHATVHENTEKPKKQIEHVKHDDGYEIQ